MDGTAGYMHGTVGYMVENTENSVCPRQLLQFLQFFSVYVRQFTSSYAKLPQVTSEGRDLELDNKCVKVVLNTF